MLHSDMKWAGHLYGHAFRSTVEAYWVNRALLFHFLIFFFSGWYHEHANPQTRRSKAQGFLHVEIPLNLIEELRIGARRDLKRTISVASIFFSWVKKLIAEIF